jgi:uncharacterized protein (TIGR02246 family)
MLARRAFPSLAFITALAACGPKPTQQAAPPATVDSAAVKSAVSALWQRWVAADTAGDVAALASMVADSARIDVRGMPPFLGRAAWQAATETAMKSMHVASMSITPEMTTAISNELAYETGNYTEQTVTGGKTAMDYGRYAGALRKDPDGQWRIAYIMVFSDSIVPVKK